MTTLQKLIVQGELQVITEINSNFNTNGKITFLLPDGTTQFGQIRSTGVYPFGNLFIDSSGMSQGVVFKTDATQGSPSLGGYGNPYTTQITPLGMFGQYLSLTQGAQKANSVGTIIQITDGTVLIKGERYSTAINTNPDFSTDISWLYQRYFKPYENIHMAVGAYSGEKSVFGFSTTTGDPTYDPFGYVGLSWGTPQTVRKALIWDKSRNLFAQNNLTVIGTVTASAYIGLPLPSFLPITLDPPNNRVGINKLTPTEALDVSGNILASGSVTGNTLVGTVSTAAQPNITSVGTLSSLGVTGTMTAGTVSATTYVGLPATNVLPITLDTVNNRVGVNKTVPTQALEVTGNILASGSVTGNTLVGTLTTAAQTNVTSLGTLSALTVTGDVTIDSSTLKVDSTNNRVGVNKSVPTQALDVTGNILASGTVTGTSLVGTLTTAAQTNVTSLGTLSALTVTGDVTIDSSTLKVDSTNNRVGINQATPSYALDVTGIGRVSDNVLVNTAAIHSSTGTPESVKTGPIGSIYMRTDGSVNTAVYFKTSGTGNTGWTAIPTTVSSGPTVTDNILSSPYTYTGGSVYNLQSATLSPGTYMVGMFVTVYGNPNGTITCGIQTTSTATPVAPAGPGSLDDFIIGNFFQPGYTSLPGSYIENWTHWFKLSSTTTLYLNIYRATGATMNFPANGSGIRVVKLA